MPVIDHVFICTAKGAPAAERLREFGLMEGPRNTHPGQGTANRRFFFQNVMLELLWVEDAMEAQSEETRPTRLWERWSGQGSPFGIILRPDTSSEGCPFPAWDYRPSGMPGLSLQIASGTGLEEPMWCYTTAERRVHPTAGPQSLTRAVLHCPALEASSVTAKVAEAGVIGLQTGAYLLELQFDGGTRIQDFR